MTSAPLKAPFPWFGGKKRVAEVAWRGFGDVPNYVEPFFGSGAVLLLRPHEPKIETVNDIDRMLVNFWRAVVASPDEVAHHADWPVNEADMHARHQWLVQHLFPEAEFARRMHTDPDFYDAKIAGWWVWGICQWIGSGWCAEPNNHKKPKLDGIGKGVHSNAGHTSQQLPSLNGKMSGMGVHSDAAHLSKQMPDLKISDGAGGRGVHASGFLDRQGKLSQALPYLRVNPTQSQAGQGVHAQSVLRRLPSLGNDRGLHGVAAPPCTDWFRALQVRLRRVRVACGDWTRVLGDSVLGKGQNVGGRRPCAVFLDPPYPHDGRSTGLYAEDDADIASRVRDWALEHGDDRDLRIALCGYEGSYEMPASWTKFAWKAARGYAAEDNENSARERIWFSPHCLPIDAQPSLFGGSHG